MEDLYIYKTIQTYLQSKNSNITLEDINQTFDDLFPYIKEVNTFIELLHLECTSVNFMPWSRGYLLEFCYIYDKYICELVLDTWKDCFLLKVKDARSAQGLGIIYNSYWCDFPLFKSEFDKFEKWLEL